MASLGLTARMHLGNPSFTGTPTHEGGGCPGQPLGHPEAEPLASHAWEGVVHPPVAGEQLRMWSNLPPYMCLSCKEVNERK